MMPMLTHHGQYTCQLDRLTPAGAHFEWHACRAFVPYIPRTFVLHGFCMVSPMLYELILILRIPLRPDESHVACAPQVPDVLSVPPGLSVLHRASGESSLFASPMVFRLSRH